MVLQKNKLTLVALTTSTDKGSIAVFKNGELRASKSWSRKTQHSEVLTPYIKQILAKARVKPGDLDAIAVDRGPGSFTGARMAVNVARTMAFSLDIPLFSQTSLAIMGYAAATEHEGPIHCLLNAHKALVYHQCFTSTGAPLAPTDGQPAAVSPEEIFPDLGPETLVIGDIPSEIWSEIKKRKPKLSKKAALNFPQARALGLMALDSAFQSGFGSWNSVEPSYVRVPDVLANVSKSQPRP